jgi:hypothetical protein
MKMKVRLETKVGRERKSVWSVFDIPDFDEPPFVIVRNGRTFRHDGLDDQGVKVYLECGSYTIPLP